jgi:hypothetical protein
MSLARDLHPRLRAAVYSRYVPFEIRSHWLFWRARRRWPTRRPETFSQKLLWKRTKDRRPILTTFADKVAVRDYVAARVGSDILTTLYAVVRNPADLDPAALPEEFVVKPSHASGMIWIVDAPVSPPGGGRHTQLAPDMFISTRDVLDWDRLVSTCRQWLSVRYADFEQEWAYRDVPPQILVEELLTDPADSAPPDYKFYVLNGRVRLVDVHMDRFGRRRQNLLRPDWSVIDAKLPRPPDPDGPPRPISLERMIEIAETLGQDTDFVRVDLYEIEGRIVFGELTNYPGSIWGPHDPPFSPHSFDVELGGYWTIPARYR